MKGQELASFLETWPDVWRHAGLWRAVVSGDVNTREVGRAYLEHLACSVEPLDVARTLVEIGAFTAAQKLLAHSAFRESLGAASSEVERIEERLHAQRILAKGDVLARWDELLHRSARAGVPLSETDSRLEELCHWSTRDLRRTRELFARLETEVTQAEAKRVTQIRSALRTITDDQTAASDDASIWRDAVERAVEARQIDVAEALLESGPRDIAATDSQPLPPWPRPWTFGADPAEVCRWALEGKGGPAEFYGLWDPWRNDETAVQLVTSMRRLCTEPQVAVDEIARFTTSFQRLLGVAALSASSVSPLSGGYRSSLDGLQHPTCPVFNGTGEILFFIEPRGQRIDPAAVSLSARAILFSANPDAERDANYLLLTPREIFRCLQRPRDFKLNILRILCVQLPPARLLPTQVPLLDPVAFAGRKVEREEIRRGVLAGSRLLTGAAGVGKTALMLRVLADLEHDGWATVYIKKTAHLHLRADRSTPLPEDLATTVSSHAEFEAYLARSQSAGLVLAVDDAHEYGTHELEALLVLSKRLGPRFRVFLAGLPQLVGKLTPVLLQRSEVSELLPLSFGVIRSFAEQVLDFTGYIATGAALDRIAFQSVGRLALLYALLRELFVEIDESGLPRSALVDLHEIETAYRRQPFRDATWAKLLEPIEREPDLHVVFAAALVVFAIEADETRRYTSAAVHDVIGWLEAEGLSIPEAHFVRCLNQLFMLNILTYQDDTKQRLMLHRGAGHLILPLLPDVGDYFDLAKQRFTQSASNKLD